MTRAGTVSSTFCFDAIGFCTLLLVYLKASSFSRFDLAHCDVGDLCNITYVVPQIDHAGTSGIVSRDSHELSVKKEILVSFLLL